MKYSEHSVITKNLMSNELKSKHSYLCQWIFPSSQIDNFTTKYDIIIVQFVTITAGSEVHFCWTWGLCKVGQGGTSRRPGTTQARGPLSVSMGEFWIPEGIHGGVLYPWVYSIVHIEEYSGAHCCMVVWGDTAIICLLQSKQSVVICFQNLEYKEHPILTRFPFIIFIFSIILPMNQLMKTSCFKFVWWIFSDIGETA